MNILAFPALVAAGYHAFALVCALRKLSEKPGKNVFHPAVSILKPIRGRDERFAEAIASHAQQNYPEYEILFGTSDPQDPAIEDIRELQNAYPHIAIRLLITPNDAPNGKVGTLEQLAASARFDVLLVNDSDILVGNEYLAETVAPLADDACGVVTCLYRAAGGSTATRFEALGIATEFTPSVLVAREVGVNEFAMGSTLAFRAENLRQIGGFRAFREYIADDYQLGKRISGLGKRVVLGSQVVETWLGSGSWSNVWHHQVRWARTIRASRAGGYLGYSVTHAGWWCLVAALAGNWRVAAACYMVRAISAVSIANWVVGDRESAKRFWWLPARDLFGFAVWVAGFAGNTVEWRGRRHSIDKTGAMRLVR